ncbi:hypothetical protein NBRC116583_34790 [Arenicella sp. 4NH20-0111]|uniref:hypothetical protein n=1 Tax=Arenicella sp. 4NH20-0111 TaxID=3127648 RepID=UPI0031020996
MSLTATTKHVKIRYNPDLVDNHNRGRTGFCRLIPEPLKQAEVRFQEHQRFDNLNNFFDDEK